MATIKVEINMTASDLVKAQVIVKDALKEWQKNNPGAMTFEIQKARIINPNEKR